MEFSETQKEIIKAIANKKVKDLNTFYSLYFNNYNTDKIGGEITKSINTFDSPNFPSFCNAMNTLGIILDEKQITKIIDFLTVWKELEKIGLIYSYDFYEKNEGKKYKYYIPLYPEQDRTLTGKFNHNAFGLIKDYLTKAIIPTEELKKFTKNYKTFEEIKFVRSLRWTKSLAIIAIAGVLFSAYFNYLSTQLQKNTLDLNLKPILNVYFSQENDSNKSSMIISNEGANIIYDLRIERKYQVFNNRSNRYAQNFSLTNDAWAYLDKLEPNTKKIFNIPKEETIRVFQLMENDTALYNLAKIEIEAKEFMPILYYKISFKRGSDKQVYSTDKYVILRGNSKVGATEYIDADNEDIFKEYRIRFEDANRKRNIDTTVRNK